MKNSIKSRNPITTTINSHPSSYNNHSNSHSNSNNYFKNHHFLTNSEICFVMSKILNVAEQEVSKNIHLFQKIDHYTINCLYYLSKMNETQDKISAIHSLEFLYNFNKGIDDYLVTSKSTNKSKRSVYLKK
jgi:hypothetical protein